MADAHDFVFFDGSPDVVHVMLVGQGGEFTACGQAFDISSDEPDYGDLNVTSRRTINCVRCAEVVEHFRGVRIAKLADRVDPYSR